MKTKLSGGKIIAFDGNRHILLEKGEIVFQGDQIIFVGEFYGEKVDRTIDTSSKLILPGFINIHTHSLSASLLYRGILEDESSALYKYLLPIRYGTNSRPPYASGEDAYYLSRVVLLEVLKSGVTTVLEQTNNLEDVLQIARALGIRIYGCHSYFSGMPFEEGGRVVYPKFKDSCPALDENLRLIKAYQNLEGGRIKVWLGPHAPDTCSTELLCETRRKATELKVGISTHVAQSPTEDGEMQRRAQKTPVEFLDDLRFWGPDVIAAHAIHTTPNDEEIMARSGMTVVHCASSYLKNGVRAPMARYRKRGINVVLGTDQNAMDFLGEMRLAMFSSKLNENDAMATTCLDILNAVTLNAAKALGRDDIGRIYPGVKADFTQINLRQPHLTPSRDPLKTLLYHAGPGDVDTVIVGGQIVMAEGKILTVDEEEIIAKADEVARRLWAKADCEVGLPRLLIDRWRS